MRTRSMLATACLAALVAAGCSGDATEPAGPRPGTMKVMIDVAPEGAHGLLLEIDGALSGPVSPVGTHQVWQHSTSAQNTTVLVRGPVSSGPLLVFPATDLDGSYSVRVLDAAAGRSAGYVRQAIQDFGVSLAE